MIHCWWINNRYNPVLSSIAQYSLSIYYLQGLFNTHKKFPTQITQNMTQGHLDTYRSTGLVCLQSAIKMQSLLTLPNTISNSQKKKSHYFFYSPIQTRILLKDRSCWVCVRKPNDILTSKPCSTSGRTRMRTKNWVKYQNSERTFQTTSLRFSCHHSQKPTLVSLF